MTRLSLARYGALELKQAYQKNLGLGLIAAGMIHLTVVLGILICSNTDTQPLVNPKPPIIITDPAKIIPPPTITQTHVIQYGVIGHEVLKPLIGQPEPVPDEKAPNEMFATQDQLGAIGGLDLKGIVDDTGQGVIFQLDKPEEILPQPEEFVPYDELPVPLSDGEYEYPPLARQAGIEGTVCIKALVDKNGTVRDAFVFKPSGSSLGFDEVAKEGAFKIKYKPAISNNQPVAVWVVYKVCFKLK